MPQAPGPEHAVVCGRGVLARASGRVQRAHAVTGAQAPRAGEAKLSSARVQARTSVSASRAGGTGTHESGVFLFRQQVVATRGGCADLAACARHCCVRRLMPCRADPCGPTPVSNALIRALPRLATRHGMVQKWSVTVLRCTTGTSTTRSMQSFVFRLDVLAAALCPDRRTRRHSAGTT